MEETPWEVKDRGEFLCEIVDANGFCLGVYGNSERQLAQHIVKAVNSHDQLVAALKAYLAFDNRRLEVYEVADNVRASLWSKARSLTVAAIAAAEAAK